MTSPTKTKLGLAWAAALVGLSAVPVQSVGAGLSGVPVPLSLPSTSVSVTAPPVALPTPSTFEAASVSVTAALTPSIPVPTPATPSVTLTAPTTTSTSGTPADSMPSVKGVTQLPSVSPRSTGTATNESQTTTSASGGQGSAGAASPYSGYSPSGGSIKPGAAASPAPRRVSQRDEARARALSLRATVQRLEGCLGNLPDQLRLALELSTGVDAPRALSPAAVAEYLHIRVGEISRLEKQALRRLRLTARTHTCGGATRTLSGLLVPSIFGPGVGKDGSAAGGVEALRYAKALSRERSGPRVKQASPGGNHFPGINIPPVADDAVLVIVILLAGSLLIGLVFADGLGLGPRHRQWRSRWMRRPPWT
jgi:hypothetical protein